MKRGFAAVMIWLVASAAAMGQEVAGYDQGTRTFIVQAVESGLAEMSLGELANQRGTSEAIKAYGRRMMVDHQRANEELRRMTDQAGFLDFPTGTSQQAQATYERLANLKGAEFDREFKLQMIRDHEAAVALFRTQAEGGQNDQIRNWARQKLPVLEEHLQQIKSLEIDQRR